MWDSAVGSIVTLMLSMLAAPLPADAQQAGHIRRIGFLSLASPPESSVDSAARVAAFRQGLRDFGWIEDQNLVMEYRYAEGSSERLRDLAAELVRLKVDVIVATAGGTRAAKEATSTIPIVMSSGDPVGDGYVASLARPGGNITGVSNMAVDLPGKQLELLKEMVPQSARVAVLMHADTPPRGPTLDNLTEAARALGLELHVVGLRRADELDTAFAAMTRAGADALIVLEEPRLLDALRGRIAALAATHRLPAIYRWRVSVEAGGLMSYGASLPDLYRRMATYVDKILKGAKPADLPVEQPMKFELVINLKTAKALGITIPPLLLFRADEVIK